jgi:hypothetical protein
MVPSGPAQVSGPEFTHAAKSLRNLKSSLPKARAQRSVVRRQDHPHRAGLLRRIASEARTSGTHTALTEGAVSYEEINGWVDGEVSQVIATAFRDDISPKAEYW